MHTVFFDGNSTGNGKSESNSGLTILYVSFATNLELIDLNQSNLIKNFSFPYLNSNIDNLYKCSIIAYVYNEDTNEVIQAEQKYIEQ